jgi:alkylhydroperoxidase family enzyme
VSRLGDLPRDAWDPAFAATVDKLTPPGRAPLGLFTAFAHSTRAWEKFSGGSLSGKGPLPFRQREIVILRTAAKTGGEFEWTTHTTLFAAKAEFTPEQVRSTFDGSPDDGNWSAVEALLIATVDALLTAKRLTTPEFDALRAHFEPVQIFEIIQLVAFYHGVSLIVGALDIPPEAGMGRFPDQPKGEARPANKDQNHA